MKKRILIVIHYLEIGGAETALIGLLNAINYMRFEVDLFLYSQRGEMLQFVPKEVNLLPEIPIFAQIERPMKDVLKDGFYRMVMARLKGKLKTRFYKLILRKKDTDAGLQYTADAVNPLLPAINSTVEYDLAISFLQPHNIVRDKVNAKKKVCWIHTDYSAVDINVNKELPVWSAFDNVISISDDVTKAFLQKFPSLGTKVVKIENILSHSFVHQRAKLIPQKEIEKERPCEKNVVRLLSIGRFCEAKNYDNVPDICKRINSLFRTHNKEIRVKWFLIGYGGDEALICQKIKEAGEEDNVIILGKRSNPYPYIIACDIYVQPSRYEGKSVTVREAQMLCKPVVVTDYPTAKSQIKHGVDGVIVPLDNEKCAQGIVDFIKNRELQSHIVDYLRRHDYGNESEINKLYKLID